MIYKEGTRQIGLQRSINNIKVRAVRAGRRQNISIRDVVIGDIIELVEGDIIPADCLLIA